ncbi:MAG: 6-carboxytetrahydropterin synthase [Armatimonadota bacterium]|nr:6-carboxytetrahydropterin synthase [Armatimonadota bacterium]
MRWRVAQWFAFEAAHFYQLPHLSAAENEQLFGKAARHHGHNYRVCVCLHLRPDPQRHFCPKALEQCLRTHLDAQFDHRCLNLEHPYFRQHLPTTENIAVYLWHDLQPLVPGELDEVEVHESDWLWSSYRGERQRHPDGEERPMVYLTRAYQFSASHRLYNPALSEEENQQLFGKCSHPYGHGHDYRLEITVRGEPDPITGMVVNLSELDALVQREVLEPLDHRFLNEEVAEFQHTIPTTEHLVQFIYQRLAPHLSGRARLYRVRLYETPRSYFEVIGGE